MFIYIIKRLIVLFGTKQILIVYIYIKGVRCTHCTPTVLFDTKQILIVYIYIKGVPCTPTVLIRHKTDSNCLYIYILKEYNVLRLYYSTQNRF